MKIYYVISLLLIITWACNNSTTQSNVVSKAEASTAVFAGDTKLQGDWDKYWYQGEAELSRYSLTQSRYGELHPGEVIMIFVTEDFLTGKQVKNDHYKGGNYTSVLKNNMIRRFSTGIYDYSIMSSIFTPVNAKEYPQSLKVTTSAQDWCGHSFQQINWRDGQYQHQLRSYFESEGDQDKHFDEVFLEDELFNRIRLDPDALPSGEFQILPSTHILRLMHLDIKAVDATAKKVQYSGADFSGEDLLSYQLSMPQIQRNVEIVFEKAFPYKIVGWKDSYPSNFSQEVLTTIARKTHERKSAYWNENNLEDMDLRGTLGR